MNIEAIWNLGTVQANTHFQKIEANIAAIAQAKSQNILTAVHRNTLAELLFGFVLLLAMSVFLWTVPPFLLILFMAYSVLTLGLSFQFWNRFRQQTKLVMAQTTKDCIIEYIQLLESYKNHLWNYSVSLIPFTVFIGFVGGYCKGSNNELSTIFQSNILWISVATILVLMAMGYFLLKAYFRNTLDVHIEALEAILSDLEKE